MVAYLSAYRTPQHGIIQGVNIMDKVTLDLNTSAEKRCGHKESYNEATKLSKITLIDFEACDLHGIGQTEDDNDGKKEDLGLCEHRRSIFSEGRGTNGK